ncbi:hypothetical protein J6590_029854 [Homalodisca vitripennis]|nr:hypothetical protein J6590_029854 [Homalodisca vitripennis]
MWLSQHGSGLRLQLLLQDADNSITSRHLLQEPYQPPLLGLIHIAYRAGFRKNSRIKTIEYFYVFTRKWARDNSQSLLSGSTMAGRPEVESAPPSWCPVTATYTRCGR